MTTVASVNLSSFIAWTGQRDTSWWRVLDVPHASRRLVKSLRVVKQMSVPYQAAVFVRICLLYRLRFVLKSGACGRLQSVYRQTKVGPTYIQDAKA
jgi:hypothetical protein